jgi:hypothetical protein
MEQSYLYGTGIVMILMIAALGTISMSSGGQERSEWSTETNGDSITVTFHEPDRYYPQDQTLAYRDGLYNYSLERWTGMVCLRTAQDMINRTSQMQFNITDFDERVHISRDYTSSSIIVQAQGCSSRSERACPVYDRLDGSLPETVQCTSTFRDSRVERDITIDLRR